MNTTLERKYRIREWTLDEIIRLQHTPSGVLFLEVIVSGCRLEYIFIKNNDEQWSLFHRFYHRVFRREDRKIIVNDILSMRGSKRDAVCSFLMNHPKLRLYFVTH